MVDPMTNDRARDVAGRLTKAQRDCLSGCIVRWRHAALAQVKAALRRKGLITSSPLGMEFTPLGLAVRAIFQEQADHD